jgi:hypothetical protein
VLLAHGAAHAGHHPFTRFGHGKRALSRRDPRQQFKLLMINWNQIN